MQKVDILELQLKEAEERETSLKRMHHTMMSAFDGIGQDDQLFETRIRVSSL